MLRIPCFQGFDMDDTTPVAGEAADSHVRLLEKIIQFLSMSRSVQDYVFLQSVLFDDR